MGNPFGIDNAYVALALPVVVMTASSLLAWMRNGAALSVKSGRETR
jgi:hypothetical protein